MNEELPCRILCHFDGIEWFAYNRTPAYDILHKILTTSINNDSNSDQLNYSSVIQNNEEIIGEYFIYIYTT